MSEPTTKQYAEFFRQIVAGRIGRDELQSLLDIPCSISAPFTATAHIEAVYRAAKKSPLTRRKVWMVDKDGNVTVTFRVATLPRRKNGYNEVAIREVLMSKGLRPPTVEEFFVCVVGQREKWLSSQTTPCEDGSCIPLHETEHSARYLAVEDPAPDVETTSCDCDCDGVADETVLCGECTGGVRPCRPA